MWGAERRGRGVEVSNRWGRCNTQRRARSVERAVHSAQRAHKRTARTQAHSAHTSAHTTHVAHNIQHTAHSNTATATKIAAQDSAQHEPRSTQATHSTHHAAHRTQQHSNTHEGSSSGQRAQASVAHLAEAYMFDRVVQHLDRWPMLGPGRRDERGALAPELVLFHGGVRGVLDHGVKVDSKLPTCTSLLLSAAALPAQARLQQLLGVSMVGGRRCAWCDRRCPGLLLRLLACLYTRERGVLRSDADLHGICLFCFD